MRIIFACDHAGFELKEHLKQVVATWGYEVEDVGAFTYDEQDDYPDYVVLAARAVSGNPTQTRAIVVGGSGQGEAIVANRFTHVRAVVYAGEPLTDATIEKPIMLTLTREHNDANVLSLGARFLTLGSAESAVRLWLDTPFSGDERHVRRIEKIDSIDIQ